VAATWHGGLHVPSEQGSAAELADALVANDLVHIAAHGQHNHDNPLFSSIRMADGPLYAYDVPPDEPVAGHVVLSACDLGLTTPRAGGEVLGLTAALLSIGTKSVVSSVSRVDDTTAYETMLRYHRLLAGGLDSPTALAEAVDGDVDLPAPFVCFGSPWSAAS
jgi:CHAT domain-containing protein